jgi:alkylated DNA repair dioxygenase AlkB
MSRAIGSSTGRAEPPAAANLLPQDGLVYLHLAAVPAAEADALLDLLRRTIDWRQETVTIMGRRLPAPRLTAWYGERAYSYSGIRHAPRPLPPALAGLRALAERVAGQAFDSVLLNLYRDGRDSMGWHADNEASLGRDPVIASISLGATRSFQLRHRTAPARVALDLTHGSCLIMAGATQHHWRHQVPKTARPVGARINLTFRTIRPA